MKIKHKILLLLMPTILVIGITPGIATEKSGSITFKPRVNTGLLYYEIEDNSLLGLAVRSLPRTAFMPTFIISWHF